MGMTKVHLGSIDFKLEDGVSDINGRSGSIRDISFRSTAPVWRRLGGLPKCPDWFEFPCFPVRFDRGRVRHSPNTHRVSNPVHAELHMGAVRGAKGGLLNVETTGHDRDTYGQTSACSSDWSDTEVARPLRGDVRYRLAVRL